MLFLSSDVPDLVSYARLYMDIFIPLLKVCLAQWVICRFFLRFGRVIPYLSIFYLVMAVLPTMSVLSHFGLIETFIGTIAFAVPVSSFFVCTYVIYDHYKKKSLGK